MAQGKKGKGLLATFKSKSDKDVGGSKSANPTGASASRSTSMQYGVPPPVVKPLAPVIVPRDTATTGLDVVKPTDAAPKPIEAPKVVLAPAEDSASKPAVAASLRVSPKKTPAVAPAAAAAPAVPAVAPVIREDAKTAWQPRPRLPSRLMDTYVNFMVLGESGLGKTTFIKNLTGNYPLLDQPVLDGSSTSLKQFHSDPYSLRTLLQPMDVPESSRRLILSIQDMPGWGDDINLVRYLRIVTDFILEQRQKDYERLAGSRALNANAMCGQLQHSITACLYFIPPHRLKKIDLILIAAISQLTAVIPVIGKSDSMTEAELAAYRNEVMGMLKAPSKHVDNKSLPQLHVNLFGFAEQVLTGLGVDGTLMPVAVVTSRDAEAVTDPALLTAMGVTGPVSQPVRRYKWGDCYPLNRNHSDLILLKRLLLGDRVETLYTMLDDSYDRYVSFCEKYEENGKQLQLVVHDYCNLSCPHMEYEDYAKTKQGLESAKRAMTALSEENKVLAERLAQSEKDRKAMADKLRANN